jgi:hypothetical protein
MLLDADPELLAEAAQNAREILMWHAEGQD